MSFKFRFIPHFLFIPLCMTILFSSCSNEKKEDAHSGYILVSIAPYKFFIEKIAGDTVKVEMMVPTGGSPHSYEPTARKVLEAGKADIWFRNGESFEKRAIQALQGYNPQMTLIDLREGIELLNEEEGGHQTCSHIDCVDPHIWLSPRLAKQQAETITYALIDLLPKYKKRYQKALQQFQQELDELDRAIQETLGSLKNRFIVVSHPAYSYFSQDYQLVQIPIEFEGKDPTPQQLTHILNKGRESNAKVVFVQAQHRSKGARLVAKELGAVVVELDPLAENYLENMLTIAKNFALVDSYKNNKIK